MCHYFGDQVSIKSHSETCAHSLTLMSLIPDGVQTTNGMGGRAFSKEVGMGVCMCILKGGSCEVRGKTINCTRDIVFS